MTVIVNGETAELEEGITVAQVLERRFGTGGAAAGVAVALNGEVVRRSEWSDRKLRSGDRVELLAARGGG